MKIIEVGAAAGPDQQTYVVCSSTKWAIHYDWPSRHEYQMIYARKTGQIAARWLPTTNGYDTVARQDPTILTSEEAQPGDPIKTSRYLIVGLALADGERKSLGIDKSNTAIRDDQVGFDILSNVLVFGEGNIRSNPMLVGCAIDQVRPGRVPYYGLMEPADGLCTPHQIHKDDIFFFHEFRDGVASTKDGRHELWEAAIVRCCVEIRSPKGTQQT